MPTSLLDADRLSLSEAARLLGVHTSTLWRWRQAGVRGRKLRCIKLGPGKTAVLRAELEAFVAYLSDPPSPADCDRELMARAAAADAKANALGL